MGTSRENGNEAAMKRLAGADGRPAIPVDLPARPEKLHGNREKKLAFLSFLGH